MLVAEGGGEEGEHAGRGEDNSKLTYIHGLVTFVSMFLQPATIVHSKNIY